MVVISIVADETFNVSKVEHVGADIIEKVLRVAGEERILSHFER